MNKIIINIQFFFSYLLNFTGVCNKHKITAWKIKTKGKKNLNWPFKLNLYGYFDN